MISTCIFKATWEEAQKACREIGTALLAVEYDEKDSCISKMAKGWIA
jgi:hypothetical protein